MEIHTGTDRAYSPRSLEDEAEIHEFVEDHRGLSIGGIDVFLINSELSTRTGVRADIIGLAETGHVVVVELKQSAGGRGGSRTALIQALEYGADFRSRGYGDLERRYQDFTGSSSTLREAHAAYFDLEKPLREIEFTMAVEPRLILLAEHFTAADIDAARYLRDTNDVDLTCVQVTPFEVDGARLYGFETRLESKTEPTVPSRRSGDESLPWLTNRLEESYFERFGDEFGLSSPTQSTEREEYRKGLRFVSAPDHPDDLRYTFKLGVFSDSPTVEFGVSPVGNETLEQIIEDHREEIDDEFTFKDTQWRRIRKEKSLKSVFDQKNIDTVSPEVSQTVSQILWEDDQFHEIVEEFLVMVEKWHEIFDAELSS